MRAVRWEDVAVGPMLMWRYLGAVSVEVLYLAWMGLGRGLRTQ